ncbi:MAG: (d)CMP kinase, partial [Spirochaetaceae bacterium]|nr:(d)CMP kinase [Spirochaetaceae bacterium]
MSALSVNLFQDLTAGTCNRVTGIVIIIDGCRFMVVAIDGPAGSGKSTVAELLARRLELDG